MENLQQATEKICDMKGNVMAVEAFLAALIRVLPKDALQPLQSEYRKEIEIGKTMLLNELVSEHTIAAFVRDSQRVLSILQAREESGLQR